MPRKPISGKERARIFELHGGICHICGGKIHAGEAWDIEHVIPYALTQDDSDQNRQLAHRKCHKAKTSADRRTIAKANRVRNKYRGYTRPKGQMAGCKNSKWKKKLNGEVVERHDIPNGNFKMSEC